MLTEERKIQMPYGADVAFHCQKCGGFVDEYGKCQFCGSQNQLRYDPLGKIQFYIEVDGSKKFYFNHITKFGEIGNTPKEIEVATLSDTTSRCERGRNANSLFDFEFVATEDSMFKTELVQNAKLFTLNISMKNLPKVFRVRCEDFSLGNVKMSESNLMTFSPTIEIHDVDGWVDASMEAPDDARCPNCGAPIRKTYGLCDYCGGWVEYR